MALRSPTVIRPGIEERLAQGVEVAVVVDDVGFFFHG
jgi:hypothetical protein